MMALSYVSDKCAFGVELYMAKMGINSPKKSLGFLYKTALIKAKEYPFFMRMNAESLKEVLELLCVFAYADYANSATSLTPCKKCGGKGARSVALPAQENLEPPRRGLALGEKEKGLSVSEQGSVVCLDCKGKGQVQTYCRYRGKYPQKKNARQNEKISHYFHDYPSPGGKKMSFSDVSREIESLITIKKTTTYKYIKPFYLMLVSTCYEEENNARDIFTDVSFR
ncbi:hypothetical protein CIG19_17085 [Enterobacterales bacterium CwR94]|nr:hypothetical protein CIG19_17085 [Enterobacterales bacterium CwR94]